MEEAQEQQEENEKEKEKEKEQEKEKETHKHSMTFDEVSSSSISFNMLNMQIIKADQFDNVSLPYVCMNTRISEIIVARSMKFGNSIYVLLGHKNQVFGVLQAFIFYLNFKEIHDALYTDNVLTFYFINVN